MVVTNLFPGGVFQLLDVLQHGHWHARHPEFVAQGLMHTIEWLPAGGRGVHRPGRGAHGPRHRADVPGDVGKPAPPGGLAGQLTAGPSRGPQEQIPVT